ncbi:hypothetical protein J1N35_040160 [Gossypium stocksii]|uniref:RNase H type-1 domain-containing protein n=1 Tax=Gossypium stocksii TaxID=47602 RepID=A0A9D3UD49_9ROSI|nr:hypothetical protein J1N35_040160 [Gossypium stocksii]
MTASFRELIDVRKVQVLGETCSLSAGHHERKWHPPVFIQAVSFVDDLGLRYVVFESNTLIVIKNICSTHEDQTEIATLIKEGFNLGMDHFWVEEILVEVEAAVAANI